jgi:hypothetical protein
VPLDACKERASRSAIADLLVRWRELCSERQELLADVIGELRRLKRM